MPAFAEIQSDLKLSCVSAQLHFEEKKNGFSKKLKLCSLCTTKSLDDLFTRRVCPVCSQILGKSVCDCCSTKNVQDMTCTRITNKFLSCPHTKKKKTFNLASGSLKIENNKFCRTMSLLAGHHANLDSFKNMFLHSSDASGKTVQDVCVSILLVRKEFFVERPLDQKILRG